MKTASKITYLIALLWLIGCKQTANQQLEEKEETVEILTIEQIMNRKATIDSINTSLNWTEITAKLWKSKNGDLGIKTREGNLEGIYIDRYITESYCDGEPLKSIIDTLSFKYIGSTYNVFYKDKENIYIHQIMSGGGVFCKVPEADVSTFEIIGDCYAKDKNRIFGENGMIIDSVDSKTFKTCDGCGCFAKDKNGYYLMGNKLDLNTITNKEVLGIIQRLKKTTPN